MGARAGAGDPDGRRAAGAAAPPGAASAPGVRTVPGQMLREAAAAFGFLVAVVEPPEGRDPSPPGPTGSLLGDFLAAVAACAHAAIRWHGYADEDLDALIGRFGLVATLAPAPGS